MYKPSDAYYKEFTTQRFDTGVATNADALPVATANRNGTDDGTFALTVANIDAGRYKVTGTVPAGYASGDVVNITVAATVNSVAGKMVLDSFVLDSKRISDLSIPTAVQIRQEMDSNSTQLQAIVAALPTMFVTATVNDTSPTSTVFKGSNGLSAVDSFYVGQFLVFTGTAALRPQARKITAYVGSTRQFTTQAFVGSPTNGDPFLIAGDVAA